MTTPTGPHEPVGGGRYHETPGRGGAPGGHGGRGGGPGGRRDTEPPSSPSELAELRKELVEFRKAVGGLTGAVDVLRSAVTESDVRPSDPSRPADDRAEKRPRRPTPSSDPALTRAERRVKIATATIVLLVTISSALGAALASAWSYIKGYGDERVASAVEVEHAKTQLEAQEKRINDLLESQKALQDSSTDLHDELERMRRSRNLLELRAKYLEEVRLALTQKRRIPDKPIELLQAEHDAEKPTK